MNLYVLMVAITVSIDSFFCGISLNNHKKIFLTIAKIISVVLLMCLFANYLGKYFALIFSLNLELLGGIIFIFIAFLEYFSPLESKTTPFYLGFAIGLDGSCANFSLAIMGYNSLIVPLCLTIFHLVFLIIGYFCAQAKFIKKISENKIISPLFFTILGSYKIISALI